MFGLLIVYLTSFLILFPIFHALFLIGINELSAAVFNFTAV